MNHPPVKRSTLESLPLCLGVEIAEVFLSVAALLELETGSVLEVPLPIQETVILKLGGTPIAEARLLVEGERYFLEVLRLFAGEETSHEGGR